MKHPGMDGISFHSPVKTTLVHYPISVDLRESITQSAAVRKPQRNNRSDKEAGL